MSCNSEDENMQFLVLLDVLVSMILMIWVAKYIFRERCFVSKKAQWIFLSIFFVIELILSFGKGEVFEIVMFLLIFLAFSIMIFIKREKRRIRGMFLFIPVLGIIMSINIIPLVILVILTNITISEMLDLLYFDLVGNLFVLVCMLLFIRHERKWRMGLSAISINKSEFELSIWERRILNSNGLLLLIICLIVTSIQDIQALAIYEKYFIAGFTVVIVMIVSSVIMMVVKSDSASYYKALAIVNEHYLYAQLEHFRAYQQTQIETKRLRHDMKNHLLCISNLYDKGAYDKLEDYLHELKDTVASIDKELHIGNDVADAIINEKNYIAKAKGMEIHTEGSMVGITEIAPIDICTIFANALDNCLEALAKFEISKPVIEISVRRDNNLVLISFVNAIGSEEVLDCDNKLKTTKKDMENHGFGMDNIRMTAEKYKGYSKFSIIDWEGGVKAFCLEVILMVRTTN